MLFCKQSNSLLQPCIIISALYWIFFSYSIFSQCIKKKKKTGWHISRSKRHLPGQSVDRLGIDLGHWNLAKMWPIFSSYIVRPPSMTHTMDTHTHTHTHTHIYITHHSSPLRWPDYRQAVTCTHSSKTVRLNLDTFWGDMGEEGQCGGR